MIPSQSRNVTTRADHPPGLIELDQRELWEDLDQQPFVFKHNLQGHPLFTLDQLAELSERVFEWPNYQRYFNTSEHKLPKDELKRILRSNILDIANNGRWLALHHIDEVAPKYAELLDQLFADLEYLSGVRIRDHMTWGSMSVFMNAPGLSVPYHFDHETNFLMQIQGEKEVRLYPPALQTLTIEEIEDFYRHNPMAARYREELADAGTPFVLTPGVAVHHPPLAAHKIQNGKDISISLAIYYTMPATEDRGRVHQVNYCLRKLGLNPRPIGESPFWDDAKIAMIRALSKSRPRTHDEMLYSGIHRLEMPYRLAKALTKKVSTAFPGMRST